MIAAASAKGHCPGTTHVVLALDEVNVIFVATQKRKKSILKIFRLLAFTVIVNDKRSFSSRTISEDL